MWQEIVAKVLSITDKIMEKFSPKQNAFRLKKERRELENERAWLLLQDCTKLRAKRILWIDERLKVINDTFRDHTTD